MISRFAMAAIAAVTLASCGQGSATARFDLSSLTSAQQQFAQPIDQLTLVVSGPQLNPIEVDVPLADPVFELDVPGGPLLFEVLAERTDGPEPVPTYYGDTRVVIPPNGSADVLIPAFPAGLLDIQVLIAPENVPELAIVSFSALAPRPDQSPVYDVLFEEGRIRRVLPSGDYTFQAQISFDDGESFVGVGPTSAVITIQQGMVLGEVLDLSDL